MRLFPRLASADRSRSLANDEGKVEVALGELFDHVPVNVLALDPATGVITYANATSVRTLEGIRHLLPASFEPRKVVGSSFDVFHKNPAHQRSIVADPSRLPWRAKIKLGNERMDLNITPVYAGGRYVAAALTWSVITRTTDAVARFDAAIGNAMSAVRRSNSAMRTAAESVLAQTHEARDIAAAAATDADETSANVRSVAAAAEELHASIAEISRQVEQSRAVTQTAVREARETSTSVQALAEASQRIGQIVSLIQNIAGRRTCWLSTPPSKRRVRERPARASPSSPRR